MPDKIRCLVVDDEAAAHHGLINYIGCVSQLELVGQCFNALEAINFLHNNKADLVFMDIKMPELTGFDFLKALTSPPAVIFTTAYSEYALESYEYGVVDYLLKPIEFSRFLRAVDRFLSLKALKAVPDKPVVQQESSITLKVDGEMVDVLLDEIIYTQSLGNYVKLVTANKNYVCSITTTDIEKRLPNNRFMRIHKSHIISLVKVDKFLYTTVLMPGAELPVGITYRRKLEEKLKEG